MLELKPLNPDSIPAAIKKARQYRLLGEPDEAESICLDILEIESEHQEALTILLLALTDSFSVKGLGHSFEKACEIAGKLENNFAKNYYLGLIYERRAKFYLNKGGPGSEEASHGWFMKALSSYEKALEVDFPENQDAILRWNSCARILNGNPEIKAGDAEPEMLLDSFETPH